MRLPRYGIVRLILPGRSGWRQRVQLFSGTRIRGKILEFIDYFNRTMSKPIKWLYSPRPLKEEVPSG